MEHRPSVQRTPEVPANALPAQWSRPGFTSTFRGGEGASLVDAAQVEVHQNSLAFRFVRLAARVPGLRRAVGAVPPRIAAVEEDGELPETALLQSPMYR